MRAKIIILTSILSVIFCTQAAATVLYVDDDANGIKNGTSWENAYTNLQDAIAGVQSVIKPVEIRVAKGTYTPDLGTGFTQGDREATFQLINNISIVGGYAGLGHTDPNARDIELYETILSGDLNNDDVENPNTNTLIHEQSRADNSFRVITCRSIQASTRIDGFTIRAGNANDTSYQNGSGIYNYYSDTTVRNCTFIENSASNGGGIYNYSCEPTITNCKFLDNMADNDGGGIYNYRSNITLTNCTINGNITVGDGSGIFNSSCNPTLTNCTFSSNTSQSDGGGIFNDYSDPEITDCSFSSNQALNDGGGINNYNDSGPTITNCTFSENIANSSGAGIYNSYLSSPQITSCSFTGNYAHNGGGIYNYHNSDPTITNCAFSKNKADSSGAGTYNYSNSNPAITNCTYTENTSISYGGGIYNYHSRPAITNCSFNMNYANKGGGLINNSNSNPTLVSCSFIENASRHGGGIYNYNNSKPIITDCTFSKNTADSSGGGIYNDNSSPTLTNCLLTRNTSENIAGGIYNYNNSNPEIINCMLSKNQAVNYAGGMYNLSSNPEITNCIFNENTSENDGGGMYNDESNPALISCTFRRNYAEVSGGGMYNLSSNISSIEKCLFSSNIAEYSGGAMYNDKCTTTLPYSIFIGNSAQYGGGINNTENSNITILNCTFEGNLSLYGDAVSCFSSSEPEDDVPPGSVKLTNCILWDEGEEIYNDSNSTITIAYCDVKGGQSNSYDQNEKIIWGEGNIETDPCFADPGYWNLNQTPEEANDDFYIEGDYHLKSQAGRFQQNSQSWVIDDVTSLCIDAGDPIIPLCLEPYPNGNRTNMGVYAGTNEASKSLYYINYFSKADCPEPDNGFVGAILDPMLCWSSDANVIEHELYFGIDVFPPFLRKQYETEFDPGALQPYTQYYWRVDDIDNSLNRVTGDIWTFKTGYYSGYPYNQNPRNGTVNVPYYVTLTWNPSTNNYGRYYNYNVYLGTDFNDVYNATEDNPLDVLAHSSTYGIDANYYNPSGLKFNQTYYWRIDENSGGGSRSGLITSKGNVWSFTTGSKPIHAYYPYPADNATDVSNDIILSWSPGSINPAAYDVYFGARFDDVNEATITNTLDVLVSAGQEPNYYNPGLLEYNKLYFWRVDEIGSDGKITKSDIWSFSTKYQYPKSRACFPAETPVWADGKMVEISKVIAGQIVGKADSTISTSGSIKGLQEHGAGMNPCYEMTLESGNTITIVHSHYFMTTSGQWKKIEELSAGMQLQTMNGQITIKSVIKKAKPFLGKSYNLMLDGSEQYFIGIDGVIALDCSNKTWEILEEARK
ncbi:MAG: right-handed parallel beta-helix repeat-containing protein [Sedimentisphaerales bacterium]|nr:right-handed parallel beta-helix repeat-containing protein [Sedimentisphaerales bacterium]